MKTKDEPTSKVKETITKYQKRNAEMAKKNIGKDGYPGDPKETAKVKEIEKKINVMLREMGENETYGTPSVNSANNTLAYITNKYEQWKKNKSKDTQPNPGVGDIDPELEGKPADGAEEKETNGTRLNDSQRFWATPLERRDKASLITLYKSLAMDKAVNDGALALMGKVKLIQEIKKL